MSLRNMKDLLIDAYKNKYAIPAFNFDNFEILMGILDGAELCNTPVIIQITEPALQWLGIENVVNIVKTESRKRNLDVALHLDHAEDFELIQRCIKVGFTSVMIDCSKQDYEHNLETTKKVVEFAHNYNVCVEGELGYVSDFVSNNDELTNIDLVKNYVDYTGIDVLGVSVGNTHGGMKRERELDIDLLKKINSLVNLPLALHGSSGVKYSMIKEAVQNGITKINTETALRVEFRNKIEKSLLNCNEIKPRNIMKEVRNGIKEKVIVLYSITGSINRAKSFVEQNNKFYFDKLNPIDKWDYIKTNTKKENIIYINNVKYNLSDIILLVLYCMDEVLKLETDRKYSYYFYGDESIRNFIEKIVNFKLSDNLFYDSMIDIDNVKMVYRFTLAKKFRENNTEIKQLRINSWGVEYLSKFLVNNKNNEIYKYISSRCKEEYINNKIVYDKLKIHLLSELNFENVEIIKNLNSHLILKLAS